MSLTALQKATAQAIVNIFETGLVLGDYSHVTLLKGDPGHLTYGRSQTTLASGNLYLLLKAYCEAEDATFAEPLALYLPRAKNKDLTLDKDVEFRRLLREAGHDPVMHTEQDAFFDRAYFNPAIQKAAAAHITLPLGIAIVYDSTVHGSWTTLRELTTTKAGGDVLKVGEKKWLTVYVKTRRNWLATHALPILRNTVYRMDTFQKLIDDGKWHLELPLKSHGVLITEDALDIAPHVVVSADDNERPLLVLTKPLTVGPVVKLVQHALHITEDGVYGTATEAAVIAFQKKKGLRPDGAVGPATYSALGL